jgi:NAD(P)-dependent dehydrogenase (short-subunit alcohol dehydrogenase family)
MTEAHPFPDLSTEFNNKRVLITGGTRGMGEAMVHRFALAGATVATTARTAPEQPDPSVLFIQADLATAQGAQLVVQRVQETFGGLDILVNNAGAAVARQGSFDSLSEDEWQDMLNVNLLAAVRLDRVFVPQMMEQGSGAVIHISSVAARVPFPHAAIAYSAAKAALAAYSKGLAKAAIAKGVRVNTVTPGFIETPLAHGFILHLAETQKLSEQAARQILMDMLGGVPLGRPGKAEEVAELVAFLASERAAFTSGANYVLDGGAIPSV